MAIPTPIRGLRSFCIAAKCLSFKHAAKQLFLTPSAVSHQIKTLEEQLGISLFKRQTRAIELTAAGKNFYDAVQPIIEELETTISDFTHAQQNQTITISLPEFFASELFVPKLSEWTTENPDINLQLETVKAGSQVANSADMSVVLVNGKPNSFIVSDLFPLHYVAACNVKQHATLHKQGFNALNSVPLILHQARPWAWHQWAEQVGFENFNPKQIIQLDSMFAVARAAQQGMGIAMIPMPISHSWFDEGFLVKLFEQEMTTNDHYYLVSREVIDKTSPMYKFSKWISNSFSESFN